MSGLWQVYGDLGADIRRICDHDEGFLSYLASLDAVSQHYVCLVVAIVDLSNLSGDRLRTLGEQIRTKKRKAVICDLYGCCPPSVLNAFSKLGKRVLTRQKYRDLLAIAENEKLSDQLRRSTRLTPTMLRAMQVLPPEVCSQKILNNLRNRGLVDALEEAIVALNKLFPAISIEKLKLSLERSAGSKDFSLSEWFDSWIERVPFPPAPWNGNSSIVPLENFSKLHTAAIEFENCLRMRTHGVIHGQEYFYRCNGKEPAIIGIQHDNLFGWGVYEIAGKKNKDVSPGTKATILDTFNDVGIEKWKSIHDISYQLHGNVSLRNF